MTSVPSDSVVDRHHVFAAALQSALNVSEVERTFLEHVDGLVSARAHALYRLDAQTGSPIAVASGVSAVLPALQRAGGAAWPTAWRQPADSSRLDLQTVWEEPEVHISPGRPGSPHALECPVLVVGVPYAKLSFARDAHDPPFTEDDMACARRIGEQIGPALERALRHEETEGRASRLESVLEHLPLPVVVTDLQANILFCNRGAAARIDGGRAPQGGTTAVYGALVEAMALFRRHNKRVCVTSVDDPAAQEQIILKSTRLGARAELAVSVLYTSTRDAAQRLPVWEVLSPREQEIAELVSRGFTTRQIAERAYVTENTVKQHLKRIFTKVDVRNRAELLQRIWTSGETPQR